MPAKTSTALPRAARDRAWATGRKRSMDGPPPLPTGRKGGRNTAAGWPRQGCFAAAAVSRPPSCHAWDRAPPGGAGGRRVMPRFGRRVVSRSQAVVVWFGVLFAGTQAGLAVLVSHVHPELRDPEYGSLARSLEARLAESPGSPLVLILGSS